MHEQKNCHLPVLTREEARNSAKVLIKISSYNLKWLIPLAKKSVLKQNLPKEFADFTILDSANGWTTILVVHQDENGKIFLVGYHPYKEDRKPERMTEVAFSIVMRIIFGKAEIVSYNGKVAEHPLEFYKDIEDRVIPVIKYLQNYSENTEKAQRKIRFNGKKFVQTTVTLVRVENEMPTETTAYGRSIKLKPLSTKATLQSLSEKGVVVVATTTENIAWLQKWSDEIRRIATKTSEYPFLSRKNDLKAKDNISAIVIQTENATAQIQVEKLEDEAAVYQLSYFEQNDNETDMVMTVKIDGQMPMYDIAFVNFNDGTITSGDDLIARKIATFFLDVLTYLRAYDWENAYNEEAKQFYGVTITPLPEKMWG